MKKLIFFLVGSLVFIGVAHAQPQDETLGAAHKFLDAIGMEESFPRFRENTTLITTNILSNALPEVAANQQQIIKRLNEFQSEYITWENVKPQYAAAAAKLYSKEELEKLAEFFSGPVGTKYLSASDDLARSFGEIYKSEWDKHKDKVINSLDDIIKK